MVPYTATFLRLLITLTSLHLKLLLDMRVLSATVTPFFQFAFILEVLFPLNLTDPSTQNQGEVDSENHANRDQDDGDQGGGFATTVATIQTPTWVPTHTSVIDLVDMVPLHRDIDHGPTK